LVANEKRCSPQERWSLKPTTIYRLKPFVSFDDTFVSRIRPYAKGKPKKVARTAVMRKLIVPLNQLLKNPKLILA